ncbi:MAG TPA: long-chain-fatty-acid--CoA ligase [Myxococcota bacterium]|nr:long-chain-fatty-acid--CoA ligase [Myxococcota bacterium]
MKNNVGLFLAKRAFLNPTLEAFVDTHSGRRFSFAELNARANRSANFLARELGVKKGERVGLLLMNGPEFLEGFFAIAKLGAICVPLNWRLVADELQFILKDSGTRTLVFGAEFAQVVAELEKRGASDVRNWVQVGGEATRGAGVLDYDSLQRAASADEPAVSACDDDLLYIMYTSGTTGLPKGAVHTHATAMWGVMTIAATAELRFKDRYLVSLPLFHVGALTPITGNVYRGITSIVMRAFDPTKVWELIQSERVTIALKVPAMLNFMLQTYDPAKYDISSLRWIMSGAAPVPVTLIEAYAKLGIEIHQVYGLTESCGPACLIGPDEALAKAGSTGKAFFHTDVRVVDDKLNDIGPGEQGEVIIRGPHVMKEYWKRPEATADAIRGGWLHSGDVATVDKEGFVYIQDRIKDMVISGGENVYPAEIENVILGNPKVGEVAVIGQPSAKWGESAFAVVVRKDASLSEREVLDWCQGKLARFKQPRAVCFIDVIPRNPSGKVLKRLLREQFPGPAPE